MPGWEMYRCRVNGRVAEIAADCSLTAPDPDRPRLLYLWADLHTPDEDGLPSESEVEDLEEMQDSVVRAAEGAGARFAGRVCTAGRVELYFYVSDAERVLQAAGEAAAEEYTISMGIHEDPGWRHYLDVLHPGPSERGLPAVGDA